jgi:hypothetical protein
MVNEMAPTDLKEDAEDEKTALLATADMFLCDGEPGFASMAVRG